MELVEPGLEPIWGPQRFFQGPHHTLPLRGGGFAIEKACWGQAQTRPGPLLWCPFPPFFKEGGLKC